MIYLLTCVNNPSAKVGYTSTANSTTLRTNSQVPSTLKFMISLESKLRAIERADT